MSGHSKWSTIKRKKGAIDAKKGALFTKIIREIMMAAKEGGADLESNFRLRTAVLKAKANNMPSDNIERGINKGLGKLEGVIYEEVRYEGYGPGGVAIMVDCLTDNKNRTTPEIRSAFNKNGGSLGESGSVNYLFAKKGMMQIDAGQTTEDELIEMLIDFDIEDIKTEDGSIIVTTTPENFQKVSKALTDRKFNMAVNEITYIPLTTVTLDEKKGTQCMRIIEILEDLDDTQNVYSNFDIPDDIMMKISQSQ